MEKSLKSPICHTRLIQEMYQGIDRNNHIIISIFFVFLQASDTVGTLNAHAEVSNLEIELASCKEVFVLVRSETLGIICIPVRQAAGQEISRQRRARVRGMSTIGDSSRPASTDERQRPASMDERQRESTCARERARVEHIQNVFSVQKQQDVYPKGCT